MSTKKNRPILCPGFSPLPWRSYLATLVLAVTMVTSHAGIEAVRVATGFNTPLYVSVRPGIPAPFSWPNSMG